MFSCRLWCKTTQCPVCTVSLISGYISLHHSALYNSGIVCARTCVCEWDPGDGGGACAGVGLISWEDLGFFHETFFPLIPFSFFEMYTSLDSNLSITGCDPTLITFKINPIIIARKWDWKQQEEKREKEEKEIRYTVKQSHSNTWTHTQQIGRNLKLWGGGGKWA